MRKLLSIFALGGCVFAQIQNIPGTGVSAASTRSTINNNFTWLNTNKAGIGTCSASQVAVATVAGGITCVALTPAYLPGEAILATNTYANPAWITSLAWSKLTGVPLLEPAITGGTTLQYLRGDKSLGTLNTSVVPESGNLYLTDARVRAVTGNLSGNAATATALAANPLDCQFAGQFANTIAANGDLGCAVVSAADLTGVLNIARLPAVILQTGATLPGTCAIGQLFFKTDATPRNLYRCTATNTWTQDPASGGGGVVGTSSPGQLLRNVDDAVAGISLATSGTSTSSTEVPTMDITQAAIDAKTVPVVVGTDNFKMARVDGSGAAGLKLYSMMPPMVFDNGSSTVAASCVVREALAGGTFTGVHLLSINSETGADISGSVTVQFSTSPATGSTTWTNIGTVALSSASRAADTTLSGWTTTVASGQLVRACITGTPTSVQKLIVSPRFF